MKCILLCAGYTTYIYPKEIIKYFNKYKSDGNNIDDPGNFTQYLYKKEDV